MVQCNALLHCTNCFYSSGGLSRCFSFNKILFNKITKMTNSEASTFPTGDHRSIQPEYGLTKREYFAGLVLQGIMSGYYANPDISATYISNKEEIVAQVGTVLDWTDELLKQLSETK